VEEAIGIYHSLMKREPGDPSHVRGLIDIYIYSDQLDKAIELAKKGLTKFQQDPFLLKIANMKLEQETEQEDGGSNEVTQGDEQGSASEESMNSNNLPEPRETPPMDDPKSIMRKPNEPPATPETKAETHTSGLPFKEITPGVQEWINEAVKLYGNKQYNEAIQILKRLRKDVGDHPNIMVPLSGVYSSMGQYSEAKDILTAGLRVKPRNTSLLYNMGNLLLINNSQTYAYAYLLTAALQGHARALERLVPLTIQLNKTNDVLEALIAKVPENPRHPTYMDSIGLLMDASGDSRDAIQWYNRGLQIDPNHVGCISHKGISLSKIGQFKAARDLFLHATGLDPKNPDHVCNIIRLYYSQKQFDTVRKLAFEGLREFPDHPFLLQMSKVR